MAFVTRSDRPRLTLSIEGAKYDVRVLGWGNYELAKHGDEGSYRTGQEDNSPRCSCPSFRFGHGKLCKHIQALLEVRLLPAVEDVEPAAPEADSMI